MNTETKHTYMTIALGANVSWEQQENQEYLGNITWTEAVEKAKAASQQHKTQVRLCHSAGYNNQGYYFYEGRSV